MQKTFLFIGAFAGMLLISLFPTLSPLDVQIAMGKYELEQVEANKGIGEQLQTTSCAPPDITDVDRCQQLESEILDVTLRLEISVKKLAGNSSAGLTSISVGHATVVGGRFLVTHNHFAQSSGESYSSQLLTLSAYRADGSLAIHQAPSHTFQVFSAGPQTLVFDFGQYDGQGALDYMGIASARLGAWDELGLRPGMEVAQVNWDGQKTHVDWVRVSTVGLENGASVLQLDNYVEPGASGGGVFFAGYHIGNNWFRNIDRHFITGKILRLWTVAALNDNRVVALAIGDADPALNEALPALNGGAPLNPVTGDAVAH